MLAWELWLVAIWVMLNSWLQGEREAKFKCCAAITEIVLFLCGKTRRTAGIHLLNEHLILGAGPAVAEVWYNIRLTLCTSPRLRQMQASCRAQGHAFVGPDGEIVLLLSHCHFPLSLFHFFLFSIMPFSCHPFPPVRSFSHLAVPAEVNTQHSSVAPGHRNLMNSNVSNLESLCVTEIQWTRLIVM